MVPARLGGRPGALLPGTERRSHPAVRLSAGLVPEGALMGGTAGATPGGQPPTRGRKGPVQVLYRQGFEKLAPAGFSPQLVVESAVGAGRRCRGALLAAWPPAYPL